MSAQKWTAGPFYTVTDTNSPIICSNSTGTGYYSHIGTASQRDPHPIHGGGISCAEANANAQLWSAAPELYAALDDMVHGREGAIERARAALGKAVGEQ